MKTSTQRQSAAASPARAKCFCCTPPLSIVRGSAGKNPLQTARDVDKAGLRLADFAPRSMLRVRETRIEKPRFPVIDVHTHLSWMSATRSGVSLGEEMT